MWRHLELSKANSSILLHPMTVFLHNNICSLYRSILTFIGEQWAFNEIVFLYAFFERMQLAWNFKLQQNTWHSGWMLYVHSTPNKFKIYHHLTISENDVSLKTSKMQIPVSKKLRTKAHFDVPLIRPILTTKQSRLLFLPLMMSN